MSKSLLETCHLAKLLFYRYTAKLFLRPPGKEIMTGSSSPASDHFGMFLYNIKHFSSIIHFNVNITFSTWNSDCVC